MSSAITIALCVLAVAVFIVVKVKLNGIYGVVAKSVASLLVVIGALTACITNNLPYYAYIVFGALCLCLIGDVLLGIHEAKISKKQKLFLNLGMLAFALAQITLIIAVSFQALQSTLRSVLVTILLAGSMGIIVALLITVNAIPLRLNFKKMTIQTTTYSATICINFIYTLFLTFLTKITWPLLIAVALFLASDLVLSYIYFGNKDTKNMDIANKVLYYLSLIMYVVYLFFFVV